MQFKRIQRFCRTIRAILRHPLSRTNQIKCLRNYFFFHLRHFVKPGAAVYPFLDTLVYRGMPGDGLIAGNIYTGLWDFEEMMFLVHFLREGDHFIDVGANVGVYSLLAAGRCHANVIAFEPVPHTFERLLFNIALNDLEESVRCLNVGLGEYDEVLQFEREKHSGLSHVSTVERRGSTPVEVKRMDDILSNQIASPVVIKIDVEGFEVKVIRGASRILSDNDTKAVIVEQNGSGARYGFSDQDIHHLLAESGLRPCRYDAHTREVAVSDERRTDSDNVIYVRDVDFVSERVGSAEEVTLRGFSL